MNRRRDSPSRPTDRRGSAPTHVSPSFCQGGQGTARARSASKGVPSLACAAGSQQFRLLALILPLLLLGGLLLLVLIQQPLGFLAIDKQALRLQGRLQHFHGLIRLIFVDQYEGEVISRIGRDLAGRQL